jgi:hypothetical protein
MELPLEIRRGATALHVLPTSDDSSTRLLVELAVSLRGTGMELGVADVQELTGALQQWLAVNGHELPDPPAGWVLLPQVLVED